MQRKVGKLIISQYNPPKIRVATPVPEKNNVIGEYFSNAIEIKPIIFRRSVPLLVA